MGLDSFARLCKIISDVRSAFFFLLGMLPICRVCSGSVAALPKIVPIAQFSALLPLHLWSVMKRLVFSFFFAVEVTSSSSRSITSGSVALFSSLLFHNASFYGLSFIAHWLNTA